MIELTKKIVLGIVNFFPQRVKIGSSARMASVTVLCIVGVCIVLCVSMMMSIERKLALFIDSYQLPATRELTVGEGSDVCFRDVPHDYLKIVPQGDGSYHWEVNPEYTDSLMYFKINDENPQKHAILDDDSQKITIRFAGDEPDTLTLTGSDVWDAWDDFDEQQDVMVRHFCARYGVENRARNDSDKLHWLGLCDDKTVCSFFERTRSGDIVLVILDGNTTITDDLGTVGYVRSGDTSADTDEEMGRCKIQFFSVSDHCYMDGEGNNGTFQVDGVNYVMKASVRLTAWGAGHAMIEGQADGRQTVRFPKALGYVGTVDSLYETSGNTSHIITFKQQGKSFPTGTDIYLPQISRAMNQDLCNVEMKSADDVSIRDNNNNIIKVRAGRTAFLPFSIVPTLNPVTLHSGRATMQCRVGFVDTSFAMSYVYLPLLVALVLLAIVLGPWSPVRLDVYSTMYDDPYYSNTQLKKYPGFFALLILIALTYCVCKSLIALKLSYTYPYFEKLTGITPVTTSLFLLVFFTLAMIFNYKVIQAQEGNQEDAYYYELPNKRKRRKWSAWTTVLVLTAGIIFVFFWVMDPSVSSGVIKSYFHSQIYSLNVFAWRDIFGINDTHRSVPYTLMLVQCLLLVVWFVQNLYCENTNVRSMFKRMEERILDRLKSARDAAMAFLLQHRPKAQDLVASRTASLRSNPRWLHLCNAVVCIVNYNRTHFLISTFVLVLIVGAAYFIDPLAKLLMLIALVWAVLSLWDAILLAVKALCPWHFCILAALVVVGPMLGNFGTAFITIAVILGLCKALSGITFDKEDPESPVDTRHTVFFEMLIIATIYIGCAMVADNGYMTNYMGFLMAVLCFYFVMDRNTEWLIGDSEQAKNETKWVYTFTLLAIVLVMLMPSICSKLFHTDDVNYSRLSRRIMLYSSFDDLQRSGYRYAETDAEFMTIMSHYMQVREGGDPLSNENHFLHASVSSGQSPVVLNDLSVPVAFIGAYGTMRATSVFFLLLLALLVLVAQFSFGHASSDGDPDTYLTHAMQWRLLALFMWVGTSLYIYLSYIGHLPFTGRLIPGFGVDAVGEALESAILLAFMASVTVRAKDKVDPST